MPLSAALAVHDISPPPGVELCGYGIWVGRHNTGVRDGLRCQALSLVDGEARVVLLVCDLIGLQATEVAEVRVRAASAAGVDPHRIVICCTHTHSGPATVRLRGWGEWHGDYVRTLLEGLAATIVEAAGMPHEHVTSTIGRALIGDLSRNRASDGGPADPEMLVLQLRRDDGSPLATLVNYSAHPVVNNERNTRVSRDFPGSMADRLAEEAGAVLFLQGSCGDINIRGAHSDQLDVVGEALTLAAQDALEAAEPFDPCPLRLVRRSIELPLQQPREQELAWTLREYTPRLDSTELSRWHRDWARLEVLWAATCAERARSGAPAFLSAEVSGLRLGPVPLLFHPAELFSSLGMEVKRRSAAAYTAVIGYAGGFAGYLPDAAGYEQEGYEAVMVPKILGLPPYTPAASLILVEALASIESETA